MPEFRYLKNRPQQLGASESVFLIGVFFPWRWKKRSMIQKRSNFNEIENLGSEKKSEDNFLEIFKNFFFEIGRKSCKLPNLTKMQFGKIFYLIVFRWRTYFLIGKKWRVWIFVGPVEFARIVTILIALSQLR